MSVQGRPRLVWLAPAFLGLWACNALVGNAPVSLWSSDAGSDVQTPGDAMVDDVETPKDTGVDAAPPGEASAARDAAETSEAEAAITLVQKTGSHFTVAGTGSQASEAFAAPNVAGNTLIVLAFWEALGYPATVTDSLGNTYSSTAVVSNPQGGALQIFYVPRSAAGANTVTLTMGAGFNSYLGLAIFEYAGLAASNVLEGTAGQGAPTGTASASTPPIATSASSSLLLAGFADSNGSGVIAPGAGWTSLVTNSDFYMTAEAMVVPATPSLQATATMPTNDNDWVSLVAAFQAAP
jgi:hypothetical protein